MIRLYVRHRVGNFAAWKKAYDAFEPTRKRLGVRDAAVFQGATVLEDVTVWHDFDTLEAAQAFMKSPELATAMKDAGVASPPDAWLVRREL